MTDPYPPQQYPPPQGPQQGPQPGPQAGQQAGQQPYGAPPPGSQPPGPQPYGAPPAYGPPPYGGPPPQYGAPQPYGAPPPARSNSTRTALIAAAAVVVIGGGVGAYFAFKGDDSTDRPAIPSSFGNYTRITNDTADRVEANMRSIGENQGGQAKEVINKAAIGVYAKGDASQPSFVYLGVKSSEVPGGSAAGRAQFMLKGALTEADSSRFPAGANGGTLICGSSTVGAVEETVCGWSDSHTSGLSVSVNPALAPSEVAGITNQLRAILDR